VKMVIKKVLRNLVYLILFSFILFGCSSGIMDDLARPNEDPTYEKPVVTSFQKENAISISWSKDVCADEYILERSIDLAVPSYSVIYRGDGTSYMDAGLIDGDCFLYRLIKIRGGRVYTPSIPVYGISSSLIEDDFEENDTKEKATELMADRISNMYYYISYDGQQVYDVDWYYVDLGPKRKAQIIITEQYPLAGDATHYVVNVNGTLSNVKNGVSFEVCNTEDVERRIPFAIEPVKAVFLTGLPAQYGGDIVSYTIKLFSVVKY